MSRFESNLDEIKSNFNESINDKMNETSIYTMLYNNDNNLFRNYNFLLRSNRQII